MNARVLRKWSLTKFLVCLWLPVIMLLVIWSQSATSMHLSTNIRANTASPLSHLPLDNIMPNGDQQPSLDHQTYKIRPAYMYAPAISNYNNNLQDPYEVFIKIDTASNVATNAANVPHVPKINSQVINLNRLTSRSNIDAPMINSGSSNSYDNKLLRHAQPQHLRSSSPQMSQTNRQQLPTLSEIFSPNPNPSRNSVETRIRERHERVSSPPVGKNYRGRVNDRLSMIMMTTENDNSNEDSTTAQIPDPMNLERKKTISTNERMLRQREKRTRTEAHRRRLMRLKQLSTNNYGRTINPTTTILTSKQQIDNDLNKLMIGRNRRDSRLYSQSAYRQQRKRPRRYCSARDPTQLAFEAPTVFEGKIISMSYDRRANFSVTFEVKEIFKKQPGYVLPHLLRLQFTYRNTSGECDIYREHMRPRGLVREELEQGRVYILFVKQINSGNFTILGQPIKKTKRAVDAVKLGVSENYAQPASIKSLTASKTLVHNGEELRIVCRVRGQPPPKVTWFKDDRSINRNRRLYQFIHLKKRSELVVKSFNSSDAGLYECRAKNKVFRKPEKRTIRIEAFSRPTDESYSHSTGDECTGNFEQYCLNGGTCQYFREISVPSCECPDGFVGDRCQEKEWNNVTPSTYKKEQQQCGENKYYGSYYC